MVGVISRNACIVALLVAIAAMGFAGGQDETRESGETKELTILTWNLPHYEDQINGWIEEFEQNHPGVTINWTDKKGSEWASYYQTQLAGGTPPDIVNVQGALWYQYAADGVLLQISDWLEAQPEVKERFYPSMFEAVSEYQGEYYMLPFYTPSTVLFYNKPMFEEAGLPGPPETFDELVEYSRALTEGERGGFITMNFDWLYWSLFGSVGVEVLNEDKTAAAFNTPTAVEALQTIADLTEAGAIPSVSWTGRWSEPNSAFGAGLAGMLNAPDTAYNAFSSNSDWATPETVGVAPFPGGVAVPIYHGLGITSTTPHPDLAWEFIKLVTSDKWAVEIVKGLGTVSGNIDADDMALNDEEFISRNPHLPKVFEVERSTMDSLVGISGLGVDSRIKDAIYSNITRAILGDTSAQQALSDAEREVNAILAE